ncbi:hypothetical protein BX600DRAFT_463084 [Xylariales sp. PMI_506]|nr:hypothetical protein BX600DRAFT_463084 [Xylariales sp. PMI_506]
MLVAWYLQASQNYPGTKKPLQSTSVLTSLSNQRRYLQAFQTTPVPRSLSNQHRYLQAFQLPWLLNASQKSLNSRIVRWFGGTMRLPSLVLSSPNRALISESSSSCSVFKCIKDGPVRSCESLPSRYSLRSLSDISVNTTFPLLWRIWRIPVPKDWDLSYLSGSPLKQ